MSRLNTLTCLLWGLLAALPGLAQGADDRNNQLLDQILAGVKPGQQTVFLGDMGFKVGYIRALRAAGSAAGRVHPNAAFDSRITTWPGGVVPYAFDDNVTADDQAVFLVACRQWEAAADVHFVPRTTQADYLFVHNYDNGGGINNSYIGLIGGAQDFNINNWEGVFVICHELGHALGMVHEQDWSDRDAYVTILTDNVQPGFSFPILGASYNATPYDFDSIMEYGRSAFSKDGTSTTIQVNPPYAAQWANAIGQSTHLSAGDKGAMGQMYGASTAPAASVWTAKSVSVGADNFTRVLWNSVTNTAAVWLVNPSGQLVSQQQYALYGRAQAIATGADNYTRVLWTRAHGNFIVQLLDANNRSVSQQQYGPYTGWQVRSMTTGADNQTRLLLTSDSGVAALWLLDPTGHYVSQQQYGPFAGWTPKSLKIGPDGVERMLWTGPGGAAAFWRLDANNNYADQQQYGPFAGFTVTDLVGAPGGAAHAVWTGAGGNIALWTLSGAGQYLGQQQYGPYSGWAEQTLAVGPDGYCHLLWDNTGGAAAFWRTDAQGRFADQAQFGPY